jgi:hypothetical protein
VRVWEVVHTMVGLLAVGPICRHDANVLLLHALNLLYAIDYYYRTVVGSFYHSMGQAMG